MGLADAEMDWKDRDHTMGLADAEMDWKDRDHPKKLRRFLREPEQQEGIGLGKDKQVKLLLAKTLDEVTAVVEQLKPRVEQVAAMRIAAGKTKIAASKADLSVTVKKKALSSPLVAGSGPGVSGTLDLVVLKREGQRIKRHVDIMRMVATVLRQLMQHRLAWPFLLPVNPAELGLPDYFKIIKYPMDLGTIRERLDGKGGPFYARPQDVAADVRLVFSNAMLYNPPDNMFHNMAKVLSEKFEEKWRTQLEPKIYEEEGKRFQEAEVQAKELKTRQVVEETAAEELGEELHKQVEHTEKRLQDLKLRAAAHCRPMSVDEKRRLGHTLSRLPPENLNTVIQIMAQKNPSFNPLSDEVELDIDAQEPSTLWLLHGYVQSLMKSWPETYGKAGGNRHHGSEREHFPSTVRGNVSLVEKPAGMTAAAAIAAAKAKRARRIL